MEDVIFLLKDYGDFGPHKDFKPVNYFILLTGKKWNNYTEINICGTIKTYVHTHVHQNKWLKNLIKHGITRPMHAQVFEKLEF